MEARFMRQKKDDENLIPTEEKRDWTIYQDPHGDGILIFAGGERLTKSADGYALLKRLHDNGARAHMAVFGYEKIHYPISEYVFDDEEGITNIRFHDVGLSLSNLVFNWGRDEFNEV